MRTTRSYRFWLVSLVTFSSFASGCSDTVTTSPTSERSSLETSASVANVLSPDVSVSATGWTFCTAAGAPCDFNGLRDVRLGSRNGAYIQQTFFGSVPCATYGFTAQNPALGEPWACYYGPVLTETISNPMPDMGGVGNVPTVAVPLGSPGSATQLVRTASGTPSFTDGSGAFRTTCNLATFSFNDPIVFPGRAGMSHLHAFFGNTGVNASSTPESLVASGNSTCRGGTLNRTAYWVPALIDSRTGTVLTPEFATFYYKTGYNMVPASIKAPPAGLRMISGDKNSLALQEYAFWGCRDRYVTPTGTVPTTCPVGDAVRLTIQFPQCWDGVNVDSPDHKSHMAYPNYQNPPQRSACPASHPIPIPAISEIYDYRVTSSSVPSSWRLSSDMYSTVFPGGLSAHADWMNGWDPRPMSAIVTQCLNKALDCQVGLIGYGRELY